MCDWALVCVEIGLCSGKGGHGRPGRVETGLLSRTLPIGTKGADSSTQARRPVPLCTNTSQDQRQTNPLAVTWGTLRRVQNFRPAPNADVWL
jgi:hypothetical protein